MDRCLRGHGTLKKVLVALQILQPLMVVRLPASNSKRIQTSAWQRLLATSAGMPCQPERAALHTCQSLHWKAAACPIARVWVRRDSIGIYTVQDKL